MVPLDQNLIDEDPLVRGQHQVGNHQSQPGQNHEDERGLRGRKPPDQADERAGPLPLLDELRAGLEGQSDSAVTALEFIEADRPSAAGRVVEVDLSPPRSLDDQEVVPLPEDNERRRPIEQPIGRLANGFAFQAMPPGGLLDIKRVTAITRDAAVFSEHIERNDSGRDTRG